MEAAEIAWARVHAAASVPGGAAPRAPADDASAPERLRALAASLRGLVETPSTSAARRTTANERERTTRTNPNARSPRSVDPREAFAALETLADARDVRAAGRDDAEARRRRRSRRTKRVRRVRRAASEATRAGGRSAAARRRVRPVGRRSTPCSGRRCAIEGGRRARRRRTRRRERVRVRVRVRRGDGGPRRARRVEHPGRKRRGKKRTAPVPGGNRTRTPNPNARGAAAEVRRRLTHCSVGPRGDRRRLERGGGGEGRVVGIVRSGVATRGRASVCARRRSVGAHRARRRQLGHAPAEALADPARDRGPVRDPRGARARRRRLDDAAGTFEAAAGAFEPVVENKAFLHSTGDSAAAAEDQMEGFRGGGGRVRRRVRGSRRRRSRALRGRSPARGARATRGRRRVRDRARRRGLAGGTPRVGEEEDRARRRRAPGRLCSAAAAALRASAFLPRRRAPPGSSPRRPPRRSQRRGRGRARSPREAGGGSGERSAGAKKSKTSAAASAALAAEVEAPAAAARETLGADAWGTTAWGASEAAAYASTLRARARRGRGGGGRGVVAARAKGGEKGATRGAAEDVVRVSFLRIVQKWMTIETRNAPPSVDDERASARFGAATLLTPGIVRGARDSEVARVLVSFDSISPGVVTKVRRRVFVSRATDSRRPEVAPRSAPRAEAPDEGEPRAFFSRRSGSARFGSVRSWPIGVRGDR